MNMKIKNGQMTALKTLLFVEISFLPFVLDTTVRLLITERKTHAHNNKKLVNFLKFIFSYFLFLSIGNDSMEKECVYIFSPLNYSVGLASVKGSKENCGNWLPVEIRSNHCLQCGKKLN